MDPLDGAASSNRGESGQRAQGSKPDGGMQLPQGIEEVVHAVPSSIPPSLFVSTADVPRRAPKAPPPLPPRPSKPSILVAPRVEIADQNERATIEVTVPEVFSKREEEQAAPPKVEATPPLRRRDPSSFPLSEKTLVLGSAIAAPATVDSPSSPSEPHVDRPAPLDVAAPSSLGAVVTYAPEVTEKPESRSDAPEDFDVARPTLPSLHRRRRKRVKRSAVAALFVSIVSAAAVLVGIAYAPSPRPPSRALANSLAAPNSPDRAPLSPAASEQRVQVSSASASAVPSPVPLPPPPAPASGTRTASESGVVKTDGSTPGRRIFVDQRTVGQTPEAITVRCGLRRVRIGSAGKTLSVDVPCGGEVSVSDR